eukprot:4763031-Amphidinium_carterae.1
MTKARSLNSKDAGPSQDWNYLLRDAITTLSGRSDFAARVVEALDKATRTASGGIAVKHAPLRITADALLLL